MATYIEITYEYVQAAMQHQVVRGGLATVADRIAGAAKGLDPSADITRSDGTRPSKGRPYSRVQSDDVAGEWGDGKTERRRTLARAAEMA